MSLGPILPTSSENLSNELLPELKLDNQHRGELAELAFMRKAASQGFAVAKPWGASDRYDVVVRFEKAFWRVQVKSVSTRSPQRGHYRIKATNRFGVPYTADEIDFFAAYVFPEDAWYILPASVVHGRTVVCLTPGSKRSKNHKYHEAWDLMKQPCIDQAAPPQNGAGIAIIVT